MPTFTRHTLRRHRTRLDILNHGDPKTKTYLEISEKPSLSELYHYPFEATQNRKKMCTTLVHTFCQRNGVQRVEERTLSISKPERTSRLGRNHQDTLEINSGNLRKTQHRLWTKQIEATKGLWSRGGSLPGSETVARWRARDESSNGRPPQQYRPSRDPQEIDLP